jgi:CBS domain containing-hemolysin-like protein
MALLVIAVVLVLLTSAICSGTEAALFSVPVIKAQQLANSNRRGGKTLFAIRQNMNRPIATVVILNNIANIVGSIAVGGIATDVLGSQWLGVFSGGLTFLVILCSEIIPKTVGEQHCDTIGLIVARPVRLLTRIFTPIIWFIEKLTAPLTKGANTPTTNEAEIRLLARVGHGEGMIEDDEFEMIQRVFRLNDLTAGDLMTPRVTMTYLKAKTTLAEAKDDIVNSPHSRIVVVNETPDEAIGIVLKAELLAAMLEGKQDCHISDLVQNVQFVLKTKKADELLLEYQANRQHLAIVVDEYGGVAGVITLEDVLEVLTGQIVDETDIAVDLQAVARQQQQDLLNAARNAESEQ